jgi:hypothetical protein
VADSGAPKYPVIHVVHPDSDVSPNEPGMVWVHDDATGETRIEDAEKYLWK